MSSPHAWFILLLPLALVWPVALRAEPPVAAEPAAPAGTTATSADPAAPSAAARPDARVNGRAIPVCSHGRLCQGAFLRALSGRP